MRHTDALVLATTLRDTSRLFVCSNCARMASLHKHHWCIRHLPLEPSGLQSFVSLLHLQVPQEISATRLDVSGWHPFMHNR